MSNKDKRFLETAESVAKIWSKDPSTKVGCVVVGDTPNLVAFGYNGFPPGIDDSADRLKNRDLKLELTLHAEVNALANAQFKVHTLYVTHHPCDRCVLHILAERSVKRVVYRTDYHFQQRWKESILKARALLDEAGIEIVGVHA